MNEKKVDCIYYVPSLNVCLLGCDKCPCEKQKRTKNGGNK